MISGAFNLPTFATAGEVWAICLSAIVFILGLAGVWLWLRQQLKPIHLRLHQYESARTDMEHQVAKLNRVSCC